MKTMAGSDHIIISKGSLLSPLKSLGEAVLELLYPQNLYCLCCGDSMENSRIHGICDVCAQKIDWRLDNPLKYEMDEFAFDELYMCCVYGFYPRQIMSRFKLAGNPYVAKPLGLLMAERLKLALSEADGPSPDALVPVPMHKDKLAKRGFNQAELLAKRVAKECGIPCIPDLLVKTEATQSMRLSSGQERRSMLEHSFGLSEKYRTGSAQGWLKGKDIILVDDVVTTGSTADACARVLKSFGASRVRILCFAGSSGWHPQPEEQ